jgi:hypothetical protein
MTSEIRKLLLWGAGLSLAFVLLLWLLTQLQDTQDYEQWWWVFAIPAALLSPVVAIMVLLVAFAAFVVAVGLFAGGVESDNKGLDILGRALYSLGWVPVVVLGAGAFFGAVYGGLQALDVLQRIFLWATRHWGVAEVGADLADAEGASVALFSTWEIMPWYLKALEAALVIGMVWAWVRKYKRGGNPFR